MKQGTRSVLQGFLFLICFLAWQATAHAQSFTLRILGRGVVASPPATGPFPTGMVKFILETSSAVSGAVSLTVGGQTCAVVAAGCVANVGSDQLIAFPQADNVNNVVV